MDTRKELDVSKSYIYNIGRYSMAAYGAGQAAWALAVSYDKDNPVKMIKPSALFLFSLMPFLPDSAWTRYPMHIYKAIQNPMGWLTQQSLGLTGHYTMQWVWNRLDPKIQNHPLALEAAGMTQLGVDSGVNKATQYVESRTDQMWQRALWRALNIENNPPPRQQTQSQPQPEPELNPTAEIALLEKQQAELDSKVAETKNEFDKVSNTMSEWKQQIAGKVNKWYQKGLCIIVEGKEVLDPQQATEHIAMKGNNGKKHRNIVFKDKFMGERHVSTITHIDPNIAAKFNEQNHAYQAALRNASSNREALAAARARQVFTQVQSNLDLVSSSQPVVQSSNMVIQTAIIPQTASLQPASPIPNSPQQGNIVNPPVQTQVVPAVVPASPPVPSTSSVQYLPQQGNIVNPPVQIQVIPAVVPPPPPLPSTSSVQSPARANLSQFFTPKRQPKNQPVLDDAAIDALNEFKKVAADYALRSPRVKNGAYAGQLPSPLREIQKTIAEIEKQKCAIKIGMGQIIAQAKLLGEDHPLLKAANQCLGSITNHHYQRRVRCG